MRRLLLLSASTGTGHKQAAQAIEQQALIDYPNIEVQHVDVAELVSTPTRRLLFDSYEIMVRQIPQLWGYLYRATDSRSLKKMADAAQELIGGLDTKKLRNLIKKFEPDHIICTHFFAADALAYSTDKSLASIPKSVVVTDYELHELWVSSPSIHYFVATDKIKEQLLERDIPATHITVSGIPVRPVFYEAKDIDFLKRTYKVPSDQPCYLTLAGGSGLIALDQVVSSLFAYPNPVTIFAIMGRNAMLQKKLKKLDPPKHIDLRVLGWVDAIDEYMRMADVVISKPGGITTSECIALKKPLVAISPIPGQEEANAAYIESHAYGVVCKDMSTLISAISQVSTYTTKKRIATTTILESIQGD